MPPLKAKLIASTSANGSPSTALFYDVIKGRSQPNALKRATPMLSSRPSSGIGDGMMPDTGGEQVSYGVVRVNAQADQYLTYPHCKGSQHVSCAINGTFYIYHESTHGDDSYLVVYLEDGLISIAGPDNPLLVNMTGEKWDAQSAGIGFSLYRMRNHVAPALNSGSVTWAATSPSTVNQEINKTDQAVETFDTSVTLSAKEGGSVTSSHSYQIWHGSEMKVTDWNVEETSDAASKTAQWLWYQTAPWSGRDHNVSNFSQWWKDAYDIGGGWDAVNGFTELSSSTLQYHSCAAWRFSSDLRTQDADGSSHLRVGFAGATECDLCLIAMPQLAGRHEFQPAGLTGSWSAQLDLVELSQLE